MKLAASMVAALVVFAGCEDAKSKLDNIKVDTSSGAAPAAPADHSGTVEERLTRLENNYAKYAEALDFLGKVYAQQKAQAEQQKREEHDPDAIFAVDIAPNLKENMVEGPNSATVTIVEAWDFA
ncbi:MAG: hypothetical protein SFX73_14915 [Kofleriaceae bacterium]|nr:hypothetical protein [Kofleriaceae bacterium]